MTIMTASASPSDRAKVARPQRESQPRPPERGVSLRRLERHDYRTGDERSSPEQLLVVAGLTTVRDLDAGEVVITEGDAGAEFFVILRGDVAVMRRGVEVLDGRV